MDIRGIAVEGFILLRERADLRAVELASAFHERSRARRNSLVETFPFFPLQNKMRDTAREIPRPRSCHTPMGTPRSDFYSKAMVESA